MITPKQISILKSMVYSYPNVTDLFKKIAVILIDNSNSLRRGARITLEHNREGYSKNQIMEAASSMHSVTSPNEVVFNLNSVVALLGTPLRFCYHHGSFGDPNRHRGPNHVGAYTFWLERHNRRTYSRRVKLVSVTREELEATNITITGSELHSHPKK